MKVAKNTLLAKDENGYLPTRFARRGINTIAGKLCIRYSKYNGAHYNVANLDKVKCKLCIFEHFLVFND